MPTVPGSMCSGSVIVTAGIEGAINGLQHTRLDGKVVRPDITFVDDPQTLASARSLVESKKRIDVLHQSIRGLAGPRRGISIIMACTKMYENDLACQILDHKKYPQWTTHTFKMLHSFPADMKLWDEYWGIRTSPAGGSWDTCECGFCHLVSHRGLYFRAFQKCYFIDTFTRISCISST
jgi:hypothetical protein